LSSLSCELCLLGKHSHCSFPSSVSQRSLSPFALVHSNIWGPSRVKSNLGFQYFVTSIDDFQDALGYFLMKNRYELFSIFQTFFNEIKNQFEISIRILRSDNAREYVSLSFNIFMKSHGIIHQTSYAYTPQQIGVTERKNRHLVETTCTLLIHGGVPQYFWSDAILSACYLINHMSSSVLENKIPHSILFPHESLHPLPPKVFGSKCFVHNFSFGLDKLSARSHKCVFLGFARSQKRYKCFLPTLNRYFISAYFTFTEFFFILSLYLLLLHLYLIKYIFQLYVILLSCLMFLLSCLLHHLLRFIVVINLPNVHQVILLWCQIFRPLRLRQLMSLIFPLPS